MARTGIPSTVQKTAVRVGALAWFPALGRRQSFAITHDPSGCFFILLVRFPFVPPLPRFLKIHMCVCVFYIWTNAFSVLIDMIIPFLACWYSGLN